MHALEFIAEIIRLNSKYVKNPSKIANKLTGNLRLKLSELRTHFNNDNIYLKYLENLLALTNCMSIYDYEVIIQMYFNIINDNFKSNSHYMNLNLSVKKIAETSKEHPLGIRNFINFVEYLINFTNRNSLRVQQDDIYNSIDSAIIELSKKGNTKKIYGLKVSTNDWCNSFNINRTACVSF